MKWVLGGIGLLLAVPVLLIGLVYGASESGEVVVLTTFQHAYSNDDQFELSESETRLWIVDFEGASYIRASSPESLWFKRIQTNPRIIVRRGDEAIHARAEVDKRLTSQINALIRAKYGWADAMTGLLGSRDHAVAIRVAPL